MSSVITSIDRHISLRWNSTIDESHVANFQSKLSDISKFSKYSAIQKAVYLNAAFKLKDLGVNTSVNLAIQISLLKEGFLHLRPTKTSEDLSSLQVKTFFGSDKFVIICRSINDTLYRLVQFSRSHLRKDPVIIQLNLSERPYPPWVSDGAWYPSGSQITLKQNFAISLKPKFKVRNWEHLLEVLHLENPQFAYTIGLPIIPTKVVNLANLANLVLLNLHNGRLPNIRGLDSPAWSLLSGIPPALTLHKIEPGVDTGKILSIQNIKCENGYPSKGDYIQAKTDLWQRTFIPNKDSSFRVQIDDISESKIKGSQFYAVHPKLRNIITESHLNY